MTNPNQPNPFEVLGLDPTTPNDQVVARAGHLRQRVTDEKEWTAIRQAVQALTGPAEERFIEEMLTHAQPCYHWPALERFRAAFRRPPSQACAQLPPCPPLDLSEFAQLLRPILADQWQPPELPLASVEANEPAEEIERQNIEALWQCLPEPSLA
jgi:hypothetical protein